MFLLTLYPNLHFGKRWGKLSFSQNLSFRIDFGCLPSPGAILIHSFSICDFHVPLITDLYWSKWSIVPSSSNTSSIFIGIGMSN